MLKFLISSAMAFTEPLGQFFLKVPGRLSLLVNLFRMPSVSSRDKKYSEWISNAQASASLAIQSAGSRSPRFLRMASARYWSRGISPSLGSLSNMARPRHGVVFRRPSLNVPRLRLWHSDVDGFVRVLHHDFKLTMGIEVLPPSGALAVSALADGARGTCDSA